MRCEPGPGHGFDTWPRSDPIRIPRVVHVSRWRYERHATSTYASRPGATVLGRESGRGMGHGSRLHGSGGVGGGLLDTRAVAGQHLGMEAFMGLFVTD